MLQVVLQIVGQAGKGSAIGPRGHVAMSGQVDGKYFPLSD